MAIVEMLTFVFSRNYEKISEMLLLKCCSVVLQLSLKHKIVSQEKSQSLTRGYTQDILGMNYLEFHFPYEWM